MAFVDDPNSNQPPAPVAGSTPLSQGEATNMSSEASQSSTGGSGVGTAPSSSTSQQTVPKASRGSGKASSGMYTNIQKYVAKNQPQAQNMAQAVTENVGKKAQNISQAVQQKAQEKQNLINTNQELMEQQRQEAANIIAQQTGLTPEGYGSTGDMKSSFDSFRRNQDNYNNWVQSTLGDKYSEYETKKNEIERRMLPMDFGPGSANEAAAKKNAEDLAALNAQYGVGQDLYSQQRFQSLMQGPQDITQVGELNLAEQQNRARALQQLAGSGATEQGRLNLLKDTFQPQGDYTRGMSGLDQLIVGGDVTARQNLIQGTAGAAEDLNKDIANQRQAALDALGLYREDVEDFGQGIRSLGESTLSDINTQLENEFNTELQNRAALTGDYGTALESMKGWRESTISKLGPLASDQDVANLILNSGVDLGSRGTNYFKTIAQADPNEQLDRMTWRIDENRFRDAINAIANQAQFRGTGQVSGIQSGSDVFSPIWANSWSSRSSSADQYFDLDTIRNALQGLRGSVEGIDPEQQLASSIQGLAGQSLDDYLKGTGLDKYDTASQETISGYENLKNLLGQTDYSSELRNTGYTTIDQMRNLLKGYEV